MTEDKLTEEELFEVQFLWKRMSSVSYLEIVLEDNKLSHYFSDLKNHRVVEIGPGNNSITKHYKCKEYIVADGHYPNDGLSILKKEKDNSAVVISFGVIDDDILKDKLTRAREGLSTRYINELVKEIRRVMNPFGIIIGNNAEKYLGEPDVSAILSCSKIGGVYLSHHK